MTLLQLSILEKVLHTMYIVTIGGCAIYARNTITEF